MSSRLIFEDDYFNNVADDVLLFKIFPLLTYTDILNIYAVSNNCKRLAHKYMSIRCNIIYPQIPSTNWYWTFYQLSERELLHTPLSIAKGKNDQLRLAYTDIRVTKPAAEAYKVTVKQFNTLPFITRTNPISARYGVMKLYSLEDVLKMMFIRFGSVDALREYKKRLDHKNRLMNRKTRYLLT